VRRRQWAGVWCRALEGNRDPGRKREAPHGTVMDTVNANKQMRAALLSGLSPGWWLADTVEASVGLLQLDEADERGLGASGRRLCAG